MASEDKPTVTFDDVAGVEEAKQELSEIVEFLKYPVKYAKLGAKIPRGVLLAGPPGTGKTLISKAVAGQAGVPFYSISGSEFVEMFVGVGASRVRDLFAKAKQSSPAILFIDEIDAVGRHRGAGIGGGNDEREQTLNQILVEMDGFDERTNVIVIAATNRPDVLDPALLRPGRFDRRVGRSGIDLRDLEEAIDRVVAGPARTSREVSEREREREIIAYHEAGHALVAAHLPEADPVHKVTIVARGSAGGYTRLLPEEDRGLWSKRQFEAMLAVMMGGQTAEELAFGDITTGASNDLQNASRIARKMVTEYGMSEGLGPQTFAHTGQDMVFLGKELSQGRAHSDSMAEKIDAEIGGLLNVARDTARKALRAQHEKLTLIAQKLLADETIEGWQLKELLGVTAQDAAPA